MKEHRCRWCHDHHDEALALLCLCSSHRVSTKRILKACRHRTHPTGEEVLLDHPYKSVSAANPQGTTTFMSIGDQEVWAGKDREAYNDLLRMQSRVGRQSAMNLIKKLRTVGEARAFKCWTQNTTWSRAMKRTFRNFDRDKSGALDVKEVHHALQSLGAKVTQKQVYELLMHVVGPAGAGKMAGDITFSDFEKMLDLMEEDESRPDLQDMVARMKDEIYQTMDGQERVHELQRLRQNKPREQQLIPRPDGAPPDAVSKGNGAAGTPCVDANAIDAACTRDGRGRTPLHALCENDAANIDMVRAVLSAFPAGVVARDSKGAMPIHCMCSNSAVTEQLLTPLIEAAKAMAPDALRVHTVFAKRDMWGQLPLHRICSN
eukprot:CAMPEP_0206219820 /NCGR_PEP_ID=MMETSP0047_2-20121206/4520_1 /ASSEMBLY_ACC=CAM_ASM_000192 /TAXON_ID=195065 /ORGANISM="Chroomonas mesostigmatica_cf, Strain CCMP1168" /LENGTH=374 /DNA_ID=CAMNT_0053642383 /DNA_START=19 /DNA_END=1141 /DNA_ORIENTATION=+